MDDTYKRNQVHGKLAAENLLVDLDQEDHHHHHHHPSWRFELKTHPIIYYDFLDLFVQEYYSYCDELLFCFVFFLGEFLGASELGNHHFQATNTGLKGEKKKHIQMRDEYWMIILVNSLLSLLRYGW